MNLTGIFTVLIVVKIKRLDIRRIVIVLVLLGFYSTSPAQVENSLYNYMLKGIYKNTVKTVNVKEVEQQQFVFIDTRTFREFEVSHIEGALFLDYDSASYETINKLNLKKNEPILVYCSVGYRSERVGEKLKKMGFKNVYNLYGGLFEWVNQDRPVVDENGVTEKVHVYDRKWGVWLQKGEKVFK